MAAPDPARYTIFYATNITSGQALKEGCELDSCNTRQLSVQGCVALRLAVQQSHLCTNSVALLQLNSSSWLQIVARLHDVNEAMTSWCTAISYGYRCCSRHQAWSSGGMCTCLPVSMDICSTWCTAQNSCIPIIHRIEMLTTVLYCFSTDTKLA
jgi:hypothetical protein